VKSSNVVELAHPSPAMFELLCRATLRILPAAATSSRVLPIQRPLAMTTLVCRNVEYDVSDCYVFILLRLCGTSRLHSLFQFFIFVCEVDRPIHFFAFNPGI